MCNDLSIGAIVEGGAVKHDKLVGVNARDLRAHTFITGKSGSGKTSFLARIVEEIILREAGTCLLLDFNCEFGRFKEVSELAFEGRRNPSDPIIAKDRLPDLGVRKFSPDDELVSFSESWKRFADNIRFLDPESAKIPLGDVQTDMLAQLFNVSAETQPGAYWMLRMLKESASLQPTSWTELRACTSKFARWSEGRVAKEDAITQSLAREFAAMTNGLDHARLRNAGDLLKCPVFDESGPGLGGDFFEGLWDKPSFYALDLLAFDYEHYRVRDFVVLFLLRRIWEHATKRFRTTRKSGCDPSKRKPLFIVIDEAHNVVPSGGTGPVDRIIETIAAEGRKFGVFLWLVSQRPDKINSKVMSECDSYILMKSTASVVEFLRSTLCPNGKSCEDFAELPNYATGHALLHGRLVGDKAVRVHANFRRTC